MFNRMYCVHCCKRILFLECFKLIPRLTETNKSAAKSLDATVQGYEESFDDFCDAITAACFDDALVIFDSREAELFALCTCISQLTNERDALVAEREQLVTDTARFQQEEIGLTEQQAVIMKKLEVIQIADVD